MRIRLLVIMLIGATATVFAPMGPTARAATGPYFGPLASVTIAVGGHNETIGIDENIAHTALTGTVVAPNGSADYLLVQQCTSAETGCTTIPSTARTNGESTSSSPNLKLTTGKVSPVAGRTYRTCAFVSVSGQTGGACSPPVFSGGQAFLGYVSQYVMPDTGLTTGNLNVHVLNGQKESALLDTWMCDSHGNACSVASTSTVRPFLPPQRQWTDLAPQVTAIHGHTYKTCALVSVSGLTAGACTPLTAF